MTMDPKTMTTLRDLMTEVRKYSFVEAILEYLKMYRFCIKTISVTVSKQYLIWAMIPFMTKINKYLSVSKKKNDRLLNQRLHTKSIFTYSTHRANKGGEYLLFCT